MSQGCSITKATSSEWGGCCFVNSELSFTLTVPLLSNIQHVQCIFSNHVVFPVTVACVYLTVAFTQPFVTVETSCQLLYYSVVNLHSVCLFAKICCHDFLLHEWFCTSSSPHGWVLTVDHFIRDSRTAGELSLPFTAASKKTFSVHASHPWRQISDFPCLFFLIIILLRLYINTHTRPWYVV